MFDSYIGDIDHDISVLAMDKILYDNGFSVTDSEIHSDSEYNTFFEALLSMDGYIDEDESDETDFTVMVFRNGCLKRYIGLALKYGSMNGIPKGNNFWISRLETHINNKMRSIGDYSYDWDYNGFFEGIYRSGILPDSKYDKSRRLYTEFCRGLLRGA